MRYRKSGFFSLAVCVAFFVSLFYSTAFSQQTFSYRNPENGYRLGMELFQKEQFLLAQEEFNKVLKLKAGTSEDVQSSAQFYFAVCAIRLEQKRAEYYLSKFISDNPVSTKTDVARYEMALLQYRQKKYRPAVKAFLLVDAFYLSPEQKDEYTFKIGYSYFNLNDYDNASQRFYKLKDGSSKYSIASNYYYAHIAYFQKNYETALQFFLKIKDAVEYKDVVPFYITQIYYLQEKYEELIEFASPLLEHANPQNSMEISRMLGEAYYRQQKFAEAIPFLKTFLENSNKSNREDFYQLGYAMYRSGDFAPAIKYLERSLSIDDALSQNAYYIMADCFLKTGKKQNARNAFRLASLSNNDLELKENALFSYAKLSFELSIQTDAVEAFQKYKRLFPESFRKDLANQYLAGIFLTTKNYRDALAAMDNIQNKNEQINSAYQRAAYFRALELYNDVKYQAATELFDKSLAYPKDATLAALANYWKGEALFNQKNYPEALKAYSGFLYAPMAVNLSLFNVANYNMGYCYFKTEDYTNASVWFRKYLKNEEHEQTGNDKARYNDALLRVADTYFVKREFAAAAEYYQDALLHRAYASDYAWFQLGMIYGIQQKPNDKMVALKMVTDSFPKSAYFDDALYETAHTAFITDDSIRALALFKTVIENYPKSSYVAKSLNGMALIFFNNKNDEAAMLKYKKVVSDFPGTSESRTALLGIKNIYISRGNSKEYLEYVATVPSADVGKATRDSVTYESAEVVYMKGDCERAVKDFGNYLADFPEGSFLLNATFYKAECEFRNHKYNTALAEYETIVSSPKSTFTETSLLRAANIYFSNGDFEKSLQKFDTLEATAELKSNIVEAWTGKMRCNFILKKYQAAISSAKTLTASEKVTNSMLSEAHLITGKSAMAAEVADTTLAIASLTQVANESSEHGAEAKYLISLIQFSQKKYSESQKTIFDLVNQVPSYDDWIARGFILLADSYLVLGDAFQAKATLESIISNYDGEDKFLIPSAVDKLNSILDSERLQHEQEMKDKLMSSPDTTNQTNPEHE